MKRKYNHQILILAVLGITSCSQAPNHDLLDTKWGAMIDELCMEAYSFQAENKIEYHNCAMDNLRTGDYVIRQDTVIVNVFHVDNTPAFAGGTETLELRFQYKFLIKPDRLEQIYFRDYKFPTELTFESIPFKRISN